jgi:transposase
MLKNHPIPEIPSETKRILKAALPKGNTITRLRDEFGTIYTDQSFQDLFPARGQPALAPWRLALVTIMQFLDNLTDRQAAQAVQTRLDWKYALSLDLTAADRTHRTLRPTRLDHPAVRTVLTHQRVIHPSLVQCRTQHLELPRSPLVIIAQVLRRIPQHQMRFPELALILVQVTLGQRLVEKSDELLVGQRIQPPRNLRLIHTEQHDTETSS